MCCGHHAMHDHTVAPNQQQHATGTLAQAAPRIGLAHCLACNAPVQDDFVFCPHCGRQLLTACPACHRAAGADWTHCAFCGADLIAEQSDSPHH